MRFVLSLLAALYCTSCGYHVGPVKPTKLQNVRRICVKNFKNETLEPRMEVMLASAVIKQLQLDGTYEITNEAHADAILQGTLTSIQRAPARALRGNVLQTTEYTLTITGGYRLTTARTGAELDARLGLTGTTHFFATSGSSGSDLLTADSASDERQAIPLAVEDLAARISSLVSEGW